MKNNIRMIACVIFSLLTFILVGTEAKAEEENILYVTFPIPEKVQIGDVPDMYEIADYISNYSSNYDEFASADFVSLADENGWAGFAYIMSVYGGIEITVAEFAA